MYNKRRDEQNTEKVTKGKRVNKAKTPDDMKKAHKNQSPQKAGSEKDNLVGGQADRLKDFAARQE